MSVRERLVLASASPRRKMLLEEAGYEFEVIAGEADESLPEGLSPEAAAVAVARRKALVVAGRAEGAEGKVILGADTIVVTEGGEILGKPNSPAEAAGMLGRLSGTTHRVITGVFIVDTSVGRSVERAVSTEVVFGEMSVEEIEAYVSSGEAMGKAGAYAIQETGDRFVREVRGSFSNVVGLPVDAVGEMFCELEGSSVCGGAPGGG